MENASKALIIAGAILISILLISIGILILNSTRGTTDSAKNTISDLEIIAFNSKFTPYEGSNKSSKEITQLLDNIISSNTSYSNQVVVRFYKETSIASKYKPHSSSPIRQELTLTHNAYISNAGEYTDQHYKADINTIKDTIKYYNNAKYDVKLVYCNEKDLKSNQNKHLNLCIGCIFFVSIDLK